ncbi:uncharacterized protein LOC111083420 [Limulus polyphemus]|uniref:Uncharacterized protein LOC111083420 n=1 Tax=Limulus polyphemus TaxID=6850 RepID=A0ABM1RW84_LIMPO|nr:uncharacterized protein LOC111083420 [Limulus polyphemus]
MNLVIEERNPKPGDLEESNDSSGSGGEGCYVNLSVARRRRSLAGLNNELLTNQWPESHSLSSYGGSMDGARSPIESTGTPGSFSQQPSSHLILDNHNETCKQNISDYKFCTSCLITNLVQTFRLRLQFEKY